MADERDDTLEKQIFKELEAGVFRKLFFLVLAGFIGVGGFLGTRDERPDPFLGREGIALKNDFTYSLKDTNQRITDLGTLLRGALLSDAVCRSNVEDIKKRLTTCEQRIDSHNLINHFMDTNK